MIHVLTKVERCGADIAEGFRNQSSATVHEASGRKGYIDSRIKPIRAGMRVCGPVMTVQCAPGDNMMLHKALELALPGDIIVAACAGAEQYGYFGDLMATSAMANNVGGLAIEGCVRDGEDIIRMGFPVFSTGLCIRGTGKGTLGLINYPLMFGGTAVCPGDLILGDDDGLVVVARADCAEVLGKVQARVEKEKIKRAALATGVSSVEYNRFGPLFEAAGLVQE